MWKAKKALDKRTKGVVRLGCVCCSCIAYVKWKRSQGSNLRPFFVSEAARISVEGFGVEASDSLIIENAHHSGWAGSKV